MEIIIKKLDQGYLVRVIESIERNDRPTTKETHMACMSFDDVINAVNRFRPKDPAPIPPKLTELVETSPEKAIYYYPNQTSSTIIGWLQQLNEPYRTEAILLCAAELHRGRAITDRMSIAISAFNWENSRFGRHVWQDVFDQAIAHESHMGMDPVDHAGEIDFINKAAKDGVFN